MEENGMRICRLCLKVSRSDYQVVDEVSLEMLDVLLLELDFSLSVSPVMCANCTRSVREFFEFKSKCLFTEDQVANFVNVVDNSGIDLLQVAYMNANPDTNSTFTSDKIICRFCMRFLSKGDCIPLNTLDDDFRNDIIPTCIPEMDLTVTESPAICLLCMESLIGYYNFMMSCVNVEKNISAYCQSQAIGDKMVNLINVYRFVLKNILTSQREVPDSELATKSKGVEIKTENVEPECSVSRNATAKVRSNNFVNIKDEDLDDIFDEELDKSIAELVGSGNGDSNIMILIEGLKREEVGNNDDAKSLDEGNISCLIDPEEVQNLDENDKITENKNESLSGSKSAANLVNQEVQEPPRVITNNEFEKFFEATMKTSNFQYTDERDVESTDGESANNETVNDPTTSKKKSLGRHAQLQSNIPLKCKECSFVTNRQVYLQQHARIHSTPEEKKAFQCPSCTYQTYREESLKQHQILHENPEDVEMYTCDKCSYSTKWRSDLSVHKLSHRPEFEAVLFTCVLCDYKTRERGQLREHMLVHQNTKLYKCEKCEFTTKYKSSLSNHRLIHKRLNESVIYGCPECPYKTKYRWCLKKHVYTHRVVTHCCQYCPYETPTKTYLKSHMSVHANAEKIDMNKCGLCTYETKFKRSLTWHLRKYHRVGRLVH